MIPAAAGPGALQAWTVLIYMAAAEPDLRPYAYADLHGMEAAFPDATMSAASTASADVIVELDLGTPETRRIQVRRAEVPYDPRRCLAPPGCSPADIRSPVVLTVDETAAPPAERLRRFLGWGIHAYPSRHVLVVVSAHGDAMDGIVFSRRPLEAIDVPSLRAVLADVSRDDLGGRPIDLYAFDACLMQSLEVAVELAGQARYLVGSEQVEDYLGLPYRSFLPRLNGTAPPPPRALRCAPRDAACEAGALLPALARAAFEEGGLYAEASPRARETMTLSAVSSTVIASRLDPSLRALSAAIEGYMREDDLRRIDLALLLGRTPGFLGGGRDLGVFLEALDAVVAQDEETPGARRLKGAIKASRAALDEAVIAASAGDRYAAKEYAGMAGISVFLPHDKGELALAPQLDPGFRGWLSRLFAE